MTDKELEKRIKFTKDLIEKGRKDTRRNKYPDLANVSKKECFLMGIEMFMEIMEVEDIDKHKWLTEY